MRDQRSRGVHAATLAAPIAAIAPSTVTSSVVTTVTTTAIATALAAATIGSPDRTATPSSHAAFDTCMPGGYG